MFDLDNKWAQTIMVIFALGLATFVVAGSLGFFVDRLADIETRKTVVLYAVVVWLAEAFTVLIVRHT